VTGFLLNINVLTALIDPGHVQHDHAHEWFSSKGSYAWATCPLTENSVLRIIGHPRYPSSSGTPAAVAELLASLRKLPGHAHWPDDISLLDPQHVNTARLLSLLRSLIAISSHLPARMEVSWPPLINAWSPMR
jgi:predicted nucleic acid-binding protein